MTLVTARALLEGFDWTKDKNWLLEQVRRNEEDLRGTQSLTGQETLAVCQVLRAVCNFHLIGPSFHIARSLEEAAELAVEVSNHKLALFANWYGACCRLARVVVRGDRSQGDLRYIARRLDHIANMAKLQRMTRLTAVVTATRVECFARMQKRPENFSDLLEGALILLDEVQQHADTRVAERSQLLKRIRQGSFEPSEGGFDQLPSIKETYITLMYKPGDLATTLMYS